jgi:hypothetical protein
MIVTSELAEMKERGSPEARRFFSVLSKWIQGAANIDDCLRAIETIVEDLKSQSFNCYAPSVIHPTGRKFQSRIQG